jgi:hypothetical protein
MKLLIVQLPPFSCHITLGTNNLLRTLFPNIRLIYNGYETQSTECMFDAYETCKAVPHNHYTASLENTNLSRITTISPHWETPVCPA